MYKGKKVFVRLIAAITVVVCGWFYVTTDENFATGYWAHNRIRAPA